MFHSGPVWSEGGLPEARLVFNLIFVGKAGALITQCVKEIVTDTGGTGMDVAGSKVWPDTRAGLCRKRENGRRKFEQESISHCTH